MMPMASVEHPERHQVLIESLIAGRPQALEELIARHEPWVRGAVFAVLGRSDDVDDVLQQVWLKVWQRRSQLGGVTNWRNWLYTLARNTAIDAGRSAARRRGLWQRVKTLVSRRRRAHGPVDEDLQAAERHARTIQAVEALDEKYRAVLVLRVWHGLGYREIARTLGITPQAVETRLVRARRMLRDKLMRGEEP